MDPSQYPEAQLPQLNVAFVQALENLEQGKTGEIDVALGNRLIRVVNDLINERLVIFELNDSADRGRRKEKESRNYAAAKNHA